jgi:RNA polymerase sigma-70 factor (ECF subfamily)
MLSSYVLSLVRDPHTAEDVLQDVAVNLIQKFDSFDGGDFDSWARQVARWHVLNVWRSRSRYRRVLKDTALSALDAAYQRSKGLHSGWEAQKDAVSQCLEKLRSPVREILELRYAQGRSLAEIGERQKKGVKAIHMSLSRAMDWLAECARGRLVRT